MKTLLVLGHSFVRRVADNIDKDGLDLGDHIDNISGEDIQRNCALGDKVLQFGMVLGMGIRFSKTTAY